MSQKIPGIIAAVTPSVFSCITSSGMNSAFCNHSPPAQIAKPPNENSGSTIRRLAQ